MTTTLIVNTLTMSTVTYDYTFTSFAKIGDKYYAADSTGLYEIDVGDLDGVDIIESAIATGEEDFGTPAIKRLSDVYVAMRADGDMEVRTTPDELPTNTYIVGTYMVESIKQRRTHIGKGARGRYWQFGVANVNGCDFEIDDITVDSGVTVRRL